jgi:inorganic pyrophosphatase
MKYDDNSAEKIKGELTFIGEKITEGAVSFLRQEYLYLTIFGVAFAALIALTVDLQEMSRDVNPTGLPFTAISYLVGCATSILAGYIGMRIAVYTNTRTTYQCCDDIHKGFVTAFRGGQVLGFCLVGLALLVLYLIVIMFKGLWFDDAIKNAVPADDLECKTPACQAAVMETVRRLFELVAGYGLGGSSVALFGRVGGGIYTKAADVGADLVGKTLKDLKEDDASNPGTIADNVGDNVGDIAGMGADLFGSLAESTCAALVVSSTSYELVITPDALWFPLMITAAGIVASFISVLFVHISTVTEENSISVLKMQIWWSSLFMTFCLIPCMSCLPETFRLEIAGQAKPLEVARWTAFGCVCCGLWAGFVIGFATEYFTSNHQAPT